MTFRIFQSTEDEWRYVFLIGAGLLIGTAAMFIAFGSVKIQKWNEITNVEETNGENVASPEKAPKLEL